MALMRNEQVQRADMLAPCTITRKEERFMEDSRGFLAGTAAFWAALLYNELPIVYTHDVPLAATDGHSCFINPTEMMRLDWTIENVTFVAAHEVSHYMLGHMIMNAHWRRTGEVLVSSGRVLPFVHQIMNMAMDYGINAMLIKAKIGEMPKQGLFNQRYSKEGMESCVEIYEILYDEMQGQEPSQKQGFDEHLEASEADQKKDAANGDIARSQAIAAAAQVADAARQGDDLPTAVKRLIKEVLTPTVRWQDHLRSTMERSAGAPALDWRQVNRRMITRPDRIVFAKKVKYGCGTIVIGWDTSGSTGKWQDAFFAEMAGIVAELNPEELIVLRCDTKVHDADQLDKPEELDSFRDTVNDKGVGGGGGTKFEPVFKWIEDAGIVPDMLVYFTDMLGSFPEGEPNYPVIWADILGRKEAPFGQVVRITK